MPVGIRFNHRILQFHEVFLSSILGTWNFVVSIGMSDETITGVYSDSGEYIRKNQLSLSCGYMGGIVRNVRPVQAWKIDVKIMMYNIFSDIIVMINW